MAARCRACIRSAHPINGCALSRLHSLRSSQVEQEDFAAGGLDAHEREFAFGTHCNSITFAQGPSIDRNVSFHNLNPGISLRMKRVLDRFLNRELTGIHASILP